MIYDGSKEIEMIYDGNKELVAVYDGSSIVWENNKIINLSSGKSWNIQSLYPNLYSKITIDNFFYLNFDQVSGSDSVTWPGYDVYLNIIGSLVKKYESGTFTSNHFHNSNQSNVTPVIVLKPEKLIELGSGQSFDVKSKVTNYQSLTADNFLIDAEPSNTYVYRGSRTYAGTWTAQSTRSFTKSYNASTGILTCYFREQGSTNSGESWNNTSDVTVYLNPKV